MKVNKLWKLKNFYIIYIILNPGRIYKEILFVMSKNKKIRHMVGYHRYLLNYTCNEQ